MLSGNATLKKYFIAYLIFIAIAVAIGAPWYKAAAYPFFAAWIYGFFYVCAKPSSQDMANVVFIVLALIIAVPCSMGFGSGPRIPIDEMIAVSEDR